MACKPCEARRKRASALAAARADSSVTVYETGGRQFASLDEARQAADPKAVITAKRVKPETAES